MTADAELSRTRSFIDNHLLFFTRYTLSKTTPGRRSSLPRGLGNLEERRKLSGGVWSEALAAVLFLRRNETHCRTRKKYVKEAIICVNERRNKCMAMALEAPVR